MFSTWCLRNFLFGLLIIALILSVLQVILIFMNNMIFGAVLMVAYIIFFQIFIFALCRDSITLFFATIVFLFIFVIGCICIQSTKTEITKIFVYDEEKKSLLNRNFVELNLECCTSSKTPSVRSLTICCHDDQHLGDPVSIHCMRLNLGKYFFTRGCAKYPKYQMFARDTSLYDKYNADPRDTEVVEVVTDPFVTADDDDDDVRSARQTTDTTGGGGGGGAGGAGGAGGPGGGKKEKKARFINELRWISNVLGIMHILMIALIFCYLYELLFGYCDHPYTYC